MSQTRNFRTEYEAFIQKYPYKTIDVNGIKVRYQYGRKKDAPVLLFFHGLEMQEMWTAYATHYEKDYRFLNYEYPLHTASIDKQMEFAYALLQKLSISRVILIGASDGGIHAQMFAKKYPAMVQGMILMTTLTLDSDYCRHIKKEWLTCPILLTTLRLTPAKKEMQLLLKKCDAFLTCESPEDQAYGKTFYETVASDLHYKEKFIHSVKAVNELKNCKLFTESDFAYLRGKVQVLLPEHDIFTKEDQDRLAALFRPLDAQILSVPGGHVGFIVQADAYLEKMDAFLKCHIVKD